MTGPTLTRKKVCRFWATVALHEAILACTGDRRNASVVLEVSPGENYRGVAGVS